MHRNMHEMVNTSEEVGAKFSISKELFENTSNNALSLFQFRHYLKVRFNCQIWSTLTLDSRRFQSSSLRPVLTSSQSVVIPTKLRWHAGRDFFYRSFQPTFCSLFFRLCYSKESTWDLAWTHFQDVKRNSKLTALILPICTITTFATDANSRWQKLSNFISI